MKYWVLGCGRIGIAVMYGLLADPETTSITVTDSSVAALRAAPEKLLRAGIARDRIDQVVTFLPMDGVSGLAERLTSGEVVLSCLPYHLNPVAAKTAVDARVPFRRFGWQSRCDR